jgi:predicted transcriptional regulator
METEATKAKQGPKKRNMPVRRFPCPDELWAAAERVGGDEDRSVSWIIRKAMEEYIERHRAAKRAAKQAASDRDLDKPTVQQKATKRNPRD